MLYGPLFRTLFDRAVFAGGWRGLTPCEKWLTPCIVYKTAMEVDFDSPDGNFNFLTLLAYSK